MSDKISMIPLRKIVVSHNPRNPTHALSQYLLGDSTLESRTPLELVHELALSEDPVKRARFVELIEEHEWKLPTGEIDPEGLVALAESRRHKALEPIMVRRFTNLENGEHVEKFGLILGERRTLSAAYLFAKYGDEPVIGGVVERMTVAQARDLAWEENRRRRPPTIMEVAIYFHDTWESKHHTICQETGRHYTMKDVARELGEDYQEFRRTEALCHLSDTDKHRLETGQIGKVKAQTRALLLKKGQEAADVEPKKENRRRVKTLKEVEAMLDVVPRNHTGYIQALADVMGITVDLAIQESNKRREAQAAA